MFAQIMALKHESGMSEWVFPALHVKGMKTPFIVVYRTLKAEPSWQKTEEYGK